MVTYASVSSGVVITGVGLVSPFGTTTEAFRNALLEGRSGLSRVTSFPVEHCRARQAALVRDFDPAQWIAPMKLRRMDDTGKFALVCSRQALADARLDVEETGRDDVGVVFGTYTAGGQTTNEYLQALWQHGPTGSPALLFNSTVGNAPASLVGLEHRLRGPNVTVSQKEASSLAAIAMAVDLLKAGRAEALITGGIDSVYSVFFEVHDSFGVLSSDDSGGECSRPFDSERNGFVMGEGGFGLVLERSASHSARNGPEVYGEILGYGAGAQSVAINAWPDAPESVARVMRLALDDAGITADQIAVVFAAANSSPGLDCVEARAIQQVFESHRPLVTSIKGGIGESGCAGAAAVIAAVVCGGAGVVPPVAGLLEPDACARDLNIVRQPASSPGPLVLVNAIASGGAICAMVLRVGERTSEDVLP